MWFRKKPKTEPVEALRALRARALTITAGDVGVAQGADLSACFGVLMETGYPEAVATLVAFVDGSTSLYFSNGGGIIGGGEHAVVRAANAALFSRVAASPSQFVTAVETPLPEVGRVRFYVRTVGGTLTAEADEQDLGHGSHALSPVFYAGHAVIAALRESTPAS